MSESYIVRWTHEVPDHPVIDELKARPGYWAIVWEVDGSGAERGSHEAYVACQKHWNVETTGPITHGERWARARYVPDPIRALSKLFGGRRNA